MEITKENYFSQEASWEFMGSTQFKDFLSCEARAMAGLKGEWLSALTVAMLQGSYVHAWSEGVLQKFINDNGSLITSELSKEKIFERISELQLESLVTQNPHAFNAAGKLKTTIKKPDLLKMIAECNETKNVQTTTIKSDFEICDKVIKVAENDPFFMRAMEGKKEVYFTAEMFGTKWKILIDSYNKKERRFTDLKCLKSLNDKFWVKDPENIGKVKPLNIIEHYGYLYQIAIYAEIERIANRRPEGDYFEPFIAVLTKENVPNKEVFSFGKFEDLISAYLGDIEAKMPRILEVKSGKEDPVKCGNCDYCRSVKMLRGTVNYLDYDFF